MCTATGTGRNNPEAVEAASLRLFAKLFIRDCELNRPDSKMVLHWNHWKIGIPDLLGHIDAAAQPVAPPGQPWQPLAPVPFPTPQSRRDAQEAMYMPLAEGETEQQREAQVVDWLCQMCHCAHSTRAWVGHTSLIRACMYSQYYSGLSAVRRWAQPSLRRVRALV